jgi:two-component system OmpR family sensor kinase
VNSLRRKLLLSLLGALFVASVLGGYATYRTALAEIDEVMDYNLRQFALSLRNQFLGQPAPPIGVPDESLDFAIQIWDSRGLRLYLSHPHRSLPSRARLGYDTVDTPDARWRVFSVDVPGRVIQVGQPLAVRSRLAAAAALRTLLPMLFMLPLMGGLIWYLVGRGLRPLEQVTRAVRRRHPEALDPLSAEHVPEEVKPLVTALNDLLHRLDQALITQRAFVADAAHELRTPLTALQLQVQLAERALDETERAETLAELRNGLQRTTHVVSQLLTLARQGPDGERAATLSDVSLAELAGRCIAQLLPLAEARAIDLGASSLDPTAVVRGDAEALASLAANLVDNAVRYTPEHGRVDVAVGTSKGERGATAWLQVADSGPGIPGGERERVFDRFYRRHGQGESGSGLGLAIVRGIAERHGGSVCLEKSALGGLLAHVELPLGKTGDNASAHPLTNSAPRATPP